MKRETIIRILFVFFILVIIGCGAYLGIYYFTSARAEASFDELAKLIVPVGSVDMNEPDKSVEMTEVEGSQIQKKFEKIYEKNGDFIGWITIADTHIDYPVMYSPNDTENGEYYIHRDFDGKYSSAGLPFIDKNCRIQPATDNLIIYGHNMKAGTMFHDIMKYEDKDFYENHKTFRFDTIYGDGEYEVIAMFYGQILPDDSDAFKYYEFVNAGSEEEFLEYIDNLKAVSIHDTGVNVSYGDKLVTLSTCAYHVKDGRFAVVAKKKQ